MAKSKILVQLDSDPQASVFDAVVAVDAGVDQLFRHESVHPDVVRDLVYGAIFTRGVDDLKSTALFIGGSKVDAGEAVLGQVLKAFVGPMRVSVMLDSNGANTTASAAVLSAAKHVKLSGATALVLGATGPVGQRVVRLLAAEGVTVRVGSREVQRARSVSDAIRKQVPNAKLEPVAAANPQPGADVLKDVQIIISAGAPGVELLSAAARQSCRSLRVAIDLSAVPPLGLECVGLTDNAKERDGALCYGAIGVGGLKMKIHKAAIRRLFEANDQVLDAEQIYRIGVELGV
jgi:methylenetetrahydrofolate/methylenetetrahydromethanopterin dehydrogenase (NADP+)